MSFQRTKRPEFFGAFSFINSGQVFGVFGKKVYLCGKLRIINMIRTFYRPDSNLIRLPIPDRYIGSELEITLFPVEKIKKSRTLGILEGKVTFSEIGDGKITMEEFLGL